jgi:hypothetical protein
VLDGDNSLDARAPIFVGLSVGIQGLVHLFHDGQSNVVSKLFIVDLIFFDLASVDLLVELLYLFISVLLALLLDSFNLVLLFLELLMLVLPLQIFLFESFLGMLLSGLKLSIIVSLGVMLF